MSLIKLVTHTAAGRVILEMDSTVATDLGLINFVGVADDEDVTATIEGINALEALKEQGIVFVPSAHDWKVGIVDLPDPPQFELFVDFAGKADAAAKQAIDGLKGVDLTPPEPDDNLKQAIHEAQIAEKIRKADHEQRLWNFQREVESARHILDSMGLKIDTGVVSEAARKINADLLRRKTNREMMDRVAKECPEAPDAVAEDVMKAYAPIIAQANLDALRKACAREVIREVGEEAPPAAPEKGKQWLYSPGWELLTFSQVAEKMLSAQGGFRLPTIEEIDQEADGMLGRTSFYWAQDPERLSGQSYSPAYGSNGSSSCAAPLVLVRDEK